MKRKPLTLHGASVDFYLFRFYCASNGGITAYRFLIMITGFAPRVSRDHLLRLTVLFLRVAILGAALAYAVVGR